MIKGGLSFSQDEVEVRVTVPLDVILAFVSGDEDGYLKIPKSTFLALVENTIQNPESDANIAQILFAPGRFRETN